MTREELVQRIQITNAFMRGIILEDWDKGNEAEAIKCIETLERAEQQNEAEASYAKLRAAKTPTLPPNSQFATHQTNLRALQLVMVYPFFSPSKHKRLEPIEFKGDGLSIQVSAPNGLGIATIWDADILFWAMMQLIEAFNQGQRPKRTIYFRPYGLLQKLGRKTGKKEYEDLKASLERLKTTHIRCNVRLEHQNNQEGFHWLDDWQTATHSNQAAPKDYWSITLSQWVYEGAIDPKEILSLSAEYTNITGGLERCLYLLARKCAGKQRKGYTISMKKLFERSSSQQEYKYFGREIRKIAKENALPDYQLIIWRDPKTDEEHIDIRLKPKAATTTNSQNDSNS